MAPWLPRPVGPNPETPKKAITEISPTYLLWPLGIGALGYQVLELFVRRDGLGDLASLPALDVGANLRCGDQERRGIGTRPPDWFSR